MEPGQTFNTVAALYDAQRSGYPDQLFDELSQACRLEPGHRVLEVGCGTGQATAGFAARGLDVVAIDPGAALVDVVRQKFIGAPNVRFEIASFEEWPLGERSFDLVAAAQSWHWVRPDIGFEESGEGVGAWRASRDLRPHSALVSRNRGRHGARISQARSGALGSPAENWYLPAGPISALVTESRCFELVAHRSYAWRRQYSSSSFAAYLGTRSDHLRLSKERRDALLSEVELALPDEVNARWATNFYVARAAAGRG